MAYEAGQQHCECPRVERAAFEVTHRLCIDAYSKLWGAFDELQARCAGVYAATGMTVLQKAGAKARATLDEARKFILHDSVACGVGGGPAHRQDAQMSESLRSTDMEAVPADDPDHEDNPAIRAMRWRTRALAAEEANAKLRAPWTMTHQLGWRAGVSDALDAIDQGGPNTRSHAYTTIEKLLAGKPVRAQGDTTMSEFKQYHRKQIAELREYVEGEVLPAAVSVSEEDKAAGSPKVGDMIARNPKNHADQWLVAAQYFKDNFEPVDEATPP